MLLFVLSTLVVFHFALPEGSGDEAAYGLLWVAIVFTALLGLPAHGCPSENRACSTAWCSPPATGARSGSARRSPSLAFLVAAELVALPAFALFFEPLDATALAGVALATSASAP